MKVHFFSGHYLLYVSDLHRISEPDRLRLHIIHAMNSKKGIKTIIIAGWGHDGKLLQ